VRQSCRESIFSSTVDPPEKGRKAGKFSTLPGRSATRLLLDRMTWATEDYLQLGAQRGRGFEILFSGELNRGLQFASRAIAA
jgi:hypothetical protein